MRRSRRMRYRIDVSAYHCISICSSMYLNTSIPQYLSHSGIVVSCDLGIFASLHLCISISVYLDIDVLEESYVVRKPQQQEGLQAPCDGLLGRRGGVMSRGATGYGRSLSWFEKSDHTSAKDKTSPCDPVGWVFSRFQNRIQSHGRGKRREQRSGEFECQDALSSVFIMTQLDCPDGA